MPALFDPFTIKDVTLRNRIGVSPMCQYSYIDGYSNDWQLMHLGSLAAGGVGLIIAEATAVEARGRITPDDVGIWSDDRVEPLQKVTRFIKSQGAVPGIQIAHAGRKACVNRPWDGGEPIAPGDAGWWEIVGASPLAFAESYQVPQELTVAEIHEIEANFAAAAVRSLAAGFVWLEIHAAHGYLLNSFLSPLSNHRVDLYGGSFENRIRFLVETVQAVSKVWPEHLPLTVRISGTEWTEGGWDIPQSVELAKVLKSEGVDLIDCSSAGNIPHAKLPLAPGYQVPIATAVREKAAIATAAVGLITDPLMANELITSGKADIVLLAREFLRNPRWAVQAAQALGAPLPVAPEYIRGYTH
jgi:2,4-dienoyl-CoA reductase-like NADH-dependent reductase (Old Yellow Enzyme family)